MRLQQIPALALAPDFSPDGSPWGWAGFSCARSASGEEARARDCTPVRVLASTDRMTRPARWLGRYLFSLPSAGKCTITSSHRRGDASHAAFSFPTRRPFSCGIIPSAPPSCRRSMSTRATVLTPRQALRIDLAHFTAGVLRPEQLDKYPVNIEQLAGGRVRGTYHYPNGATTEFEASPDVAYNVTHMESYETVPAGHAGWAGDLHWARDVPSGMSASLQCGASHGAGPWIARNGCSTRSATPTLARNSSPWRYSI